MTRQGVKQISMTGCEEAGTKEKCMFAGKVVEIITGEVKMNELWEKVYKAYTFSFPLMIMDATVRVCTNTVEPGGTGKAPANRWMHAQELATASFRQVVTPNVDTIYSQI